jgi:hypothetical protein
LYEITIGTFVLAMILLVLITLIRHKFYINTNTNIDKILLFAIIVRLMWMIAVIALEDKMTFFVYDDETYYKTAMGAPYGIYSNLYTYFLRWLYNTFGQSSLNGRIVNLVFSVMTIYPLAYLEKSFDEFTDFKATTFFALSPFQIFISFFEIKDIILMFTFTASYALIKHLKIVVSTVDIIELALLCFISEQIRSGMGAIPIVLLVIDKVKKGIGATKLQRMFSCIIIVGICVAVLLFYFGDYILEQSTKIEKYQKWIFTQFSSESIYNQFVITGVRDLWKLPFSFILYAIQPLNALDGSSRFFGEWGMFAKFFDVPILLMALRWLVTYIKEEKLYSLMFLLPYAFVSGVNLTNARQGFFLYPTMYLICFYGYSRVEMYSGNNAIIRFFNSKLVTLLLWAGLYVMWLFVLIMRV